MKKYMILATVAALTLASCAKLETGTRVVVDENIPIGFASYTSRALTKANTGYYVDGTTASNLISNTTFGVYAWVVENTMTPWSENNNVFDFTGSEAPTFMNNVPVTFKGDGAGNDGSNNVSAAGYYSENNPVRYWPSGDTPSGLSFFAYYPANGTGITMPTKGLGATTFTAQTDAAAQIDFMVAPVVADQYYGHTNSSYSTGSKGTVDFTFKHTLTKVRFYFNTDNTDTNTEVKLTGATLSGVYKTNTLTTGYTKGSGANAGTFSYSWGNSPSNADGFNIKINGNTPAPSSNEITLANDGTFTTCTLADEFLMVPQTIAATQQKLTITWTVKTGSGPAVTNTKTIDLYDIKNGENRITWAMNNQINYRITVGPKPIYFTATVTPWTTTETTGTINVN